MTGFMTSEPDEITTGDSLFSRIVWFGLARTDCVALCENQDVSRIRQTYCSSAMEAVREGRSCSERRERVVDGWRNVISQVGCAIRGLPRSGLVQEPIFVPMLVFPGSDSEC